LLATESTWRWRSVAENVFNRFWIQMVRSLSAARRDAGGSRGMLVLEPETVEVGDFVQIQARILDDAFVPWHEQNVPAEVRLAGSTPQEVTLAAIPGRDGWYSTRVRADEEGVGVVNLTLPGVDPSEATDGPPVLQKFFRVTRTDTEMQRLALDRSLLQTVANATSGRYFPLSDARQVPEYIESAAEIRVDRGPQEELWDEWWVLTALALLVTIEWTLRRKHNLL
jgi:hypothetical protein